MRCGGTGGRGGGSITYMEGKYVSIYPCLFVCLNLYVCLFIFLGAALLGSFVTFEGHLREKLFVPLSCVAFKSL